MCICIKFNVATVNPKILMFKWLPKKKQRTEMLYFLTEHTLTVYVPFIIREKLHLFMKNR